ncbi:DVU_1551 family NTP transferase [Desulfocurvibacter africanus]|uniref:Metal dependent phosphohydrolase n=1 Tax=Desulfocurvibacter africanus subsp. africanus str. Walvis Bay TaxID=690850 RepID=F3YZ14_DESAF|nr:NTP transferase domain-containing protein [Desulfocurvibacter africanus]EGJ49659.1 metal dependent phosphohydrolase [Desulfocurvibacter africanus subsp. africanus str. Walvis Bay]
MADVVALVLAAGLSSRMTGFKPLLDLGGRSSLVRTIDLFHAAGVMDVRVVTGHRAAETRAEAVAAGADVADNLKYREGMFSSIQAGVRSLPPGAPFLLLPVDIPLVRPGTVRLLLDRHADNPERILHPTYQGERGHPPLLPADLRADILAWGGEGGLMGLLAHNEQRALDIPLADSHILLDMDTDQDATALAERLDYLDYPDREECETLLALRPNVNERGLAHSRAVERFASAMAGALLRAGYEPAPDARLVTAAALLHDVAKGLPSHEREGGRILDHLGFPRVARIVEAHRDIDLPEGAPLTEREIVYLADKLAKGQQLVSVEERFEAKLRLHGHDPEAAAAIRGRMGRALSMQKRMETAMGCSLEQLLGSPGGIQTLLGS